MRILHTVYTPRLSGAEVLVSKLSKEHVSSGIPTAVVSLNPAEANFFTTIVQQQQENVKWFCPAFERPTKLQRFMHLRKVIRSFAPTIVFAHSVIPAAYMRLATQMPVWSVLHAAGDNYNTGYLAASEYLLKHRSAGVICVSDQARMNYLDKFGDITRVQVIQNGIDLAPFTTATAPSVALRQELQIPDHAHILLQVGRITAIKNQSTSVDALPMIVAAGIDAHLVLVGQTDEDGYLGNLHRQVESLKLQDRVHFLGGRTDVPLLMLQSDTILMPSEREAHSLAFLEALAADKPIIASDIASFAFASDMVGVRLFGAGKDAQALAAATLASTRMPKSRITRNMTAFDIRATARAYEAIANEYD